MAGRANRFSDLVWRKSTKSSTDNECVEVAELRASVLVRDSRDPGGAVLELDVPRWRALLDGIRER
ncbi:DUF397 domain-containing protein [Actinomadura parmotrematis]|uniref:DUF397 domain-containing protein n=1 Tax=Actinomadura parmotrematis TaxID=2864039 RepID=A0ABS7FZL8_9ACTN|nr:DUF397 domain-containing protein [Actinomadura parmotrematis]MBW8485893.1 DUF397 domain-containing protein [Actinomadura parmotrematis]